MRLTFESGRDSPGAECVRVWPMRTGISITLKPAARRRLKALAKSGRIEALGDLRLWGRSEVKLND